MIYPSELLGRVSTTNTMTWENIMWSVISMMVSSICYSCVEQIGDQIEELSGDYVYRVDGSMRYILPDHIFHEGIYPNVLAYAFNDDYILVLQEPSKKHVTSFLSQDIRTRFIVLSHADEIKELDPEDEKIMAQGYIQDSSFYSMLSTVLSPNNTSEDRRISTEIAEELLEKNPYFSSLLKNELNYWIIDHTRNVKFGPLSKEEFEDQSLKLEVPKELRNEFKTMLNRLIEEF